MSTPAIPLPPGNEPNTPTTNMVTICAWCPELNILKLQRREYDVVIIYQHGKELRIIRNGTNLMISHGICEPCKAKNFPPKEAA